MTKKCSKLPTRTVKPRLTPKLLPCVYFTFSFFPSRNEQWHLIREQVSLTHTLAGCFLVSSDCDKVARRCRPHLGMAHWLSFLPECLINPLFMLCMCVLSMINYAIHVSIKKMLPACYKAVMELQLTMNGESALNLWK